MIHPLNNYFDKIYCISLLERNDRREKVISRFNNLGINVEFFNAVRHNWTHQLLRYMSNTGEYDFINPGEIGCTISHYSCIYTAKIKGYKNVLILEDDAVFLNNFNDIIQSYLEKIPNDWNMIYLGSNTWEWTDRHIDVVPNFIKRAYKSFSTCAYAINSNFYDVILNHLSNKLGVIDNLYMKLQENDKNKIYMCIPNLIAQDWSYSDITQNETNYFHKSIVSYLDKTPEDYK